MTLANQSDVRIAVLDDWQNAAAGSADWTALKARAEVVFFDRPFASQDEAAQALAAFDIVLAMRERTPFPMTLVERLPRLRMFALTGSRGALVDIAGMVKHGIVVCTTGTGPGAESTAEMALALMLAIARDVPAGDAAARAGRFQQGTRAGMLLAGKTLGVMGLGNIGSRMAGYGRALGMKVQAWSQNMTAEAAQAAGATLCDKAQLLAGSDVVSLHLVLSDRTRGIVGRAELAAMKPGAILVNTSRAGLVDEAALTEAVQGGRLFAALDVHHREPLPAGSPLAACRNTVLTPHYGYGTAEVFGDFYQQLVENALAYLDGQPIRTVA
ncbi:D-2-hydroxyacid dehydrogenase family protein [Variovorax sp. dw_954]|uniref:D-2-hydroxyacid dehydrogenase family protein n=1 Tax=Variovorax sp. dw_954 TaxID=2720078 RepID=UPI001BD30CEC|nr:D-2-hydroxyacid dehydrogenase family protein [Variovorax sp. dw_954]